MCLSTTGRPYEMSESSEDDECQGHYACVTSVPNLASSRYGMVCKGPCGDAAISILLPLIYF